MVLIKTINRFFTFLNTTLILLLLIIFIFLYGSISMPFHEEFNELYFMALLRWMIESPLSITWWLWLAVIILMLLTINTILCSIQSIVRKSERRRFSIIIAPQMMHAGFLFILFGHLLSSSLSEKALFVLNEGSQMPFGTGYIRIERFDLSIDKNGYIDDMSVKIRYISSSDELYEIRPNKPFISEGKGLYLKMVRPYPYLHGVFEYSKEPGAIPALIGGVLFFIGNILLLFLRRKR